MNQNNIKLSTLSISYIASLKYFWNLAHSDICVLTDHLQYTKRSPVSISPPLLGGNDQLRIPVKHDGKKLPISKKCIDTSAGFYNRHLKTLTHTYHNFPYGYYYLPQMEKLMHQNLAGLSEYLYSWLKLIVKWLHLPIELHLASQTSEPGFDDSFIIDICNENNGNTYINDEEVFNREWIHRKVLEKEGIQTAIFPDFPDANIFQSHRRLSVVTFLMRFGPEAGFLIKQFK